MHTFVDYIVELFDKPFSLTATEKPSKLGSTLKPRSIYMDSVWHAEIPPPKDFAPTAPTQTLRIFIEGEVEENEYSLHVLFDVDGSFNVTNRGRELTPRIFATVITAIAKDIKYRETKFKTKVGKIIFTADKKLGPSRLKLYKALVNRFGKKHGFKKIKIEDHGGSAEFIVSR